jgi:hypothetical protein
VRKATRTGFATLGVALVAAAVGPRARAQSVVVGPQANAVSASRDSLITVPIVANLTGSGGASLGSITARLTWRASILAFRGFALGTAGSPVASADSAAGTLRFALANAGGLTGTPVLINAQFAAKGVAGDTTNLKLSVDEITAAGTFANLLGITSVTSSQFCVAAGKFGDLDGNGLVNSFDALLIVTSAVGLPIAPNTTANGDVDGSGKVDTRDALVVLSFAVGLPTAPYPVGALNSFSCALRSPTTVAIAPGPVGMAVGDRFPLAVTTRDSVNAIVNTGAVTWSSLNPLVATVDAFGRVLGVAAGSTQVVARVTPTVMASVTVTVSAARHVWYVNAAVAAGNAVELGSQTYPFSTTQQGVAAAAPGDTVRLAVATYAGTLLIRKPLVVIGDSDATGFPLLRNAAGPAVAVDTAGAVRISRFRIEDSQVGVSAVGVDTLDLRAVRIARSRDAGIRVRKSGYVTIGVTSVTGAVHGIDAESTATLRVRQTAVDLIAAGAAGAPGFGLRAFNVDTVVADTTSLTTAGAKVDSARTVRLRNVTVTGSPGGLGVPVVKLSGVGSVRIAQSRFAANAYGEVLIENTPGGAATITVDTSTFDSTNLRVHGPASFAMRGGQVLGGAFAAVWVDSAGVVSLVGIEIASTIAPGIASVSEGPPLPTDGGPWAVTVFKADSLHADSLWIHDNLAGALGALNVTAVSAYGNLIEANAQHSGPFEVRLYQTKRARIAHSVFDDRAGSATRSLDVVFGLAGGARVVVDTSTFWNPSYGVYAAGSGAIYNDTLVVRGSLMEPGNGVSQIYDAIVATSVGHVAALGNTLDSAYNFGVYIASSGNAEVRDNIIRNVQNGVYLYSASQGDSVSGNTIACTPSPNIYGIGLFDAPAVVTANMVRSCGNGISVTNSTGIPYAAEVRGNSVVGDSVSGTVGIQLSGAWTRPVVALNDVSAGRFGSAGVLLEATGVGIDSARVDSNTVRDGIGPAIQTTGGVVGVSIRGNVIARFQGFGSAADGGISINHSGGGATIVNNRVSFARSMPGVQLYQAGGTITLDSNVVVDGDSSGVQLTGLPVTVTGRLNFVARNYRGFYGTTGTVTIDSSTIQGNTFRGADGVTGWTFASNYWGDPLGPLCDLGLVGCTGTVGDHVAGVAFLPFLAAAVGTPVGAPPAIRLALTQARIAAVRAAPLRSVAGATRAVRASHAPPTRFQSPAAAEARRRMAEEQKARIRAAGVGARP